MEDKFQDPHWMPETTDGTKRYMYNMFFPVHTYAYDFSLA